MVKHSGQTVVGRHVKVNLGADGIYIGELLEVPQAHWHGRVRITGVLSPAQYVGDGVKPRRGLRPGEFVVAREYQLSETTAIGHETYLGALKAAVNQQVGSHAGIQGSVSAWVGTALARAFISAYHSEELRLRTGTWRVAGAA